MDRKTQLQEETHYWVMKFIEEHPEIKQRDLARELGISLGAVNFCVKALVEKGWVKVHNFSENPNKLAYLYLLTPKGMAEKAQLTRRFLVRKREEYEALERELALLEANARFEPKRGPKER